MKKYTGTYALYNAETGECHGDDYVSVEEAVSCAAGLRGPFFYLTTCFEDGRNTVLTVEEFNKALKEYWEKEED
jgi:hypothetical protein